MDASVKNQITALCAEYNIALDADDEKFIQKILDGWTKIRPLTLQQHPDGRGVRISYARDRHYEKDIVDGGTKVERINRSIVNVANENTDLILYRVDLSDTGIAFSQKTPEPTETLDQAIHNDDGYKDETVQLSVFTDDEQCEQAVKALTNAIVLTFEVTGLVSKSLLESEANAEKFHQALTKILAAKEKARVVSTFLKFSRHIDPGIRSIMHATKIGDTQTLNWLYADGDSQKKKYRLQAAQAYPLFLPIFLKKHHELFLPAKRFPPPWLRESDTMWKTRQAYQAKFDQLKEQNDRLLKNIDEAVSITDLIGTCLGTETEASKRTIRNLGRIKEMPANMPYNEFIDAIPYLDQFDSNWHPKTAVELADFVECVKRAKTFEYVTARPVTEILKRTKGKWTDWKEKTVSLQAIVDIRDWLKEMRDALILPYLISQLSPNELMTITDSKRYQQVTGMPHNYSRVFGHSTHGVLDDLCNLDETDIMTAFLSNVSELDLLSCSLRWHEQGETYAARKQAIGIEKFENLYHWLPLTKPAQSPDSLWITPLTSKADLDVEGKAMGHCVGWNGYDMKCLTQNDHIVSVTGQDRNDRFSTVHLREVFDTAGNVSDLEIIQNQGRRSDETKKALKWYVNQIFKNPAMQPDWKEMERLRKQNRETVAKNGLSAILGFDLTDREQCVKAFENIRAYLPERHRHQSYDDFIGAAVVSETLQLRNSTFGKRLMELGIIQQDPSQEVPQKEDTPARQKSNRLMVIIRRMIPG